VIWKRDPRLQITSIVTMVKNVSNQYDRKDSGFTSGFFWGAALGAIGMFLFGTKKGRNIREYMSQHGGKFLEEFEEFYEEVEEQGNVAADDSKSKKKKITKRLGAGKKQDLNHIKSLQERGRKAAKRFFTRSGKLLKA